MSKPKPSVVPDWMDDELQAARHWFGLDASWFIRLELTSRPNGSAGLDGSVESDSVYLNATIQLKKGLENDGRGKRVILHEVGHVAHSEIDRIVFLALAEIMDESQRDTLRQLYIDSVERFLQRLVRGHIGQPLLSEDD